MQKTVYWDLINSNVNKRDVQTGCSGYVHKAAIRVMRIFTVNNLVSVYETGFVFGGKKHFNKWRKQW